MCWHYFCTILVNLKEFALCIRPVILTRDREEVRNSMCKTSLKSGRIGQSRAVPDRVARSCGSGLSLCYLMFKNRIFPLWDWSCYTSYGFGSPQKLPDPWICYGIRAAKSHFLDKHRTFCRPPSPRKPPPGVVFTKVRLWAYRLFSRLLYVLKPREGTFAEMCACGLMTILRLPPQNDGFDWG